MKFSNLLYSLTVGATLLALTSYCAAQNSRFPEESVDLIIASAVELPPADATTESVVAAARAFLNMLSEEQTELAVYAFDDNEQRARWSNLPVGLVERGGIFQKDLSEAQNAALQVLLAEVLSDEGLRNAHLQIAADDYLLANGGRSDFGADYYYIAFVGEPAIDAPWMLQYGGHHLAINSTFAGPQASFSPMLTGGQPITFEYQGQQVNITREETEAAQTFLDSLDAAQKAMAVRSGEPIQFLLGPGEHGTSIAPEGISGADLSAAQKQLLLAVVDARVGHFNDRDAVAKMAIIRANLDETFFAWWGPEGQLGAAYFRITGPEIVMEYSPQTNADIPSEHIHSIYRDPTNDYGAAWVERR